jgi:ATP-dependent RNA helicase UAP56/SUB2
LFTLFVLSSFKKGVNVQTDINALKVEVPHVVVGTPGRIMDLATSRKVLDLSHVQSFVLDECDRMLAEVSMRRDVQTIFKATPHEKQVMMFSATLDKEVRAICRKFCQNVRDP